MKRCVVESRLGGRGSVKKFTNFNASCTSRFNKYECKGHLAGTFYKILRCYGIKERTAVCTS